ncbi:hypothetical protein BJD99_01345 [Rhodococcus sp. 1163]|uniref:FAD-dependent oxidoreductase n=1 Tax=Rhodococcus sp. 1163 TaxID=1905289 RepID=UPI000A0E1A44|nr:FAD-dependent monooxygenase [Rhodococcus sp. 1163]ORI19692.1 hypothetical protein BJD99_01345 [Rhodococcus sp. 1163]
MTARVLVVGAGPVGLTTACELARQNIAVRIVDRQTSPSIHSRAAVIWPRQLELLRRIEVTSDLIGAGHRLDNVSFYSEGRRRGGIVLSRLENSIHPYAITIPQNATERILAAKLRSYGVEIERGTELLHIDNGHDEPYATLRSKDAALEGASFDWVIGADGAHSSVRRLLGVPFTPTSTDLRFGICDVAVADGPANTAMHYYYSPTGAIGLAPMRHGIYRVAMSVPARTADGAVPPPPVREDFQHALDTRAPGAGTLDIPEWAAAFDVRFGTAERFREGRCFLVGDAAHIMSPAGGQGMNTGLQDAVNLGWKLAAVICGHADRSLLDTYETERRSAALHITRSTGVQLRLGLVDGPIRRRVRDVAITLADRTGVLQRVGAPIFSQLDVTYSNARRPALVSTLEVGDRFPAFAPDPAADTSGETGSWPTLDCDRLTLVLWPGVDPIQGWSTFVRGTAAALPEIACVDGGGIGNNALTAHLGRKPRLFLCRPDGHLLMRSALDIRRGAQHAVRTIGPHTLQAQTSQKETTA